MTTFRELGADQIIGTIARLRDRIAERFPDSGLSRVAADLLGLARHTAERVRYLRQPDWRIRIGVAVVIAAMLLVLIVAASSVRLQPGVSGMGEFIQVVEAAINDLIFLFVAVFFLSGIEGRIKRRRALDLLHQLRSLAHVVDMHQLTKDPEILMAPPVATASSPERTMTARELGRYLDYSSELLSLVSKVAVLVVQRYTDPVVLVAVNEIEELTSGLSGKIWQKITLLERITARIDGRR